MFRYRHFKQARSCFDLKFSSNKARLFGGRGLFKATTQARIARIAHEQRKLKIELELLDILHIYYIKNQINLKKKKFFDFCDACFQLEKTFKSQRLPDLLKLVTC